MAQTTVRINKQSLERKKKKLEGLFGDTVVEKLTSYATYAITISPVLSGAYVESMSIRPRGSSSGRSRRSDIREPALDKEAKKQEAIALVQGDAERFKDEILDTGGAVLINRAPHAAEVESKYQVFGATKDRFR